MASALATHDYEQTRDELARAIRTRRSDCSPHELEFLRELPRHGDPVLDLLSLGAIIILNGGRDIEDLRRWHG